MSTTPRTDARELAISIQNEDSCCAIYVKIDGKEYEGGLVDSDFARKLECENARLRGWLRHLNEAAARNGWHIYSVSTSAALRGEMPPAIPDSKP
jgi:hypothetical protein